MIIQFNRNFPPYNSGERADFAGPEGARLVAGGIAQAVVSAADVEIKDEAAEITPAAPKPAGKRK